MLRVYQKVVPSPNHCAPETAANSAGCADLSEPVMRPTVNPEAPVKAPTPKAGIIGSKAPRIKGSLDSLYSFDSTIFSEDKLCMPEICAVTCDTMNASLRNRDRTTAGEVTSLRTAKEVRRSRRGHFADETLKPNCQARQRNQRDFNFVATVRFLLAPPARIDPRIDHRTYRTSGISI